MLVCVCVGGGGMNTPVVSTVCPARDVFSQHVCCCCQLPSAVQGKGCGRILLNLTYRTLWKMPRNELAGSPNDCLGIVVVRVVKCSGLAKTTRPMRALVRASEACVWTGPSEPCLQGLT